MAHDPDPHHDVDSMLRLPTWAWPLYTELTRAYARSGGEIEVFVGRSTNDARFPNLDAQYDGMAIRPANVHGQLLIGFDDDDGSITTVHWDDYTEMGTASPKSEGELPWAESVVYAINDELARLGLVPDTDGERLEPAHYVQVVRELASVTVDTLRDMRNTRYRVDGSTGRLEFSAFGGAWRPLFGEGKLASADAAAGGTEAFSQIASEVEAVGGCSAGSEPEASPRMKALIELFGRTLGELQRREKVDAMRRQAAREAIGLPSAAVGPIDEAFAQIERDLEAVASEPDQPAPRVADGTLAAPLNVRELSNALEQAFPYTDAFGGIPADLSPEGKLAQAIHACGRWASDRRAAELSLNEQLEDVHSAVLGAFPHALDEAVKWDVGTGAPLGDVLVATVARADKAAAAGRDPAAWQVVEEMMELAFPESCALMRERSHETHDDMLRDILRDARKRSGQARPAADALADPLDVIQASLKAAYGDHYEAHMHDTATSDKLSGRPREERLAYVLEQCRKTTHSELNRAVATAFPTPYDDVFRKQSTLQLRPEERLGEVIRRVTDSYHAMAHRILELEDELQDAKRALNTDDEVLGDDEG